MSKSEPPASDTSETAPVRAAKVSWRDQSITVPFGVVLMLVGTVFGTATSTGLVTVAGGSDDEELAEIKLQLHDVQRDLHELNDKLAEITAIIDRAYPRAIPGPPTPP